MTKSQLIRECNKYRSLNDAPLPCHKDGLVKRLAELQARELRRQIERDAEVTPPCDCHR